MYENSIQLFFNQIESDFFNRIQFDWTKTNFCLEKGIFTALAAATATKGTNLATIGGAFREYIFKESATAVKIISIAEFNFL